MLGIIACSLLALLRVVAKRPIFFTVPFELLASITSPTRKGLKIIIIIPLAKLDNDPCNAKPIATKPLVIIAINWVAGKPITCTIEEEGNMKYPTHYLQKEILQSEIYLTAFHHFFNQFYNKTNDVSPYKIESNSPNYRRGIVEESFNPIFYQALKINR